MFKYSLSKYKYMCKTLDISPKGRIFAPVIRTTFIRFSII